MEIIVVLKILMKEGFTTLSKYHIYAEGEKVHQRKRRNQ